MFSPPKLTCILLPNLPIQVERERCPPDVPLLVSHPIERDRVMAASDDAAAAGVRVGLALHQARQATPAALAVDANEADYHLRHDAVANALLAYTPNLETVTLGEFLVDARGFNQNDCAPALEQGCRARRQTA